MAKKVKSTSMFDERASSSEPVVDTNKTPHTKPVRSARARSTTTAARDDDTEQNRSEHRERDREKRSEKSDASNACFESAVSHKSSGGFEKPVVHRVLAVAVDEGQVLSCCEHAARERAVEPLVEDRQRSVAETVKEDRRRDGAEQEREQHATSCRQARTPTFDVEWQRAKRHRHPHVTSAHH
jgi:hypothetical protein